MSRPLSEREQELARMAARAVEDGHSMGWMFAFTTCRRDVDIMDRAARQAKEALERHEAAFIPTR